MSEGVPDDGPKGDKSPANNLRAAHLSLCLRRGPSPS